MYTSTTRARGAITGDQSCTFPKSTRRTPLSKHWCYTINNPTPRDGEIIHDSNLKFLYHVCGREVGENGTRHMQGYVVFVNRCRLSSVKKIFPRAHLEIKRGTVLEASEYCKKDGDFIEVGELPITLSERNRKDWDAVYKAAAEGRMDDIPRDMYVRYMGNLHRIHRNSCVHGCSYDQVFSCLSTY